MSTSPTRNTRFQGSRVPKRPQRRPKSLKRSIQNHIDFCIDLFTDFLLILTPFWAPFGIQFGCKIVKNRAPLSKAGGPWNRLGAQGVRGYRPDPKTDQNGSHLEPQGAQNEAKRVPLRVARDPPKKTKGVTLSS